MSTCHHSPPSSRASFSSNFTPMPTFLKTPTFSLRTCPASTSIVQLLLRPMLRTTSPPPRYSWHAPRAHPRDTVMARGIAPLRLYPCWSQSPVACLSKPSRHPHVSVLLVLPVHSLGRSRYPSGYAVEWFSVTGTEPDAGTDLWVAELDLDGGSPRSLDTIDVKTTFRSAYLIPVFGERPVPPYMRFSDSLDSCRAYYANRYADRHAHEGIF